MPNTLDYDAFFVAGKAVPNRAGIDAAQVCILPLTGSLGRAPYIEAFFGNEITYRGFSIADIDWPTQRMRDIHNARNSMSISVSGAYPTLQQNTPCVAKGSGLLVTKGSCRISGIASDVQGPFSFRSTQCAGWIRILDEFGTAELWLVSGSPVLQEGTETLEVLVQTSPLCKKRVLFERSRLWSVKFERDWRES